MLRLSDCAFKAEPAEFCPVCGKAKKMLITRPSKYGGTVQSTVGSACDCTMAAIKAEEDRREEEKRLARERERYARAFGDREVRGDFRADDGRNDGLMAACRNYASQFDEIRGMKSNGLLLFGPSRKGKTFAAEAVAMALHRNGMDVMMDTAAGFVQQMQSFDGREALMRRVAKCDLLVVDDFGASRNTSFGNEAVFSVIDARVSANGPLVATTNLTVSDMMEVPDMDERRASMRILERCLPVEVNPDTSVLGNAEHGELSDMIFAN